jgi:hypothetical protein
VSLEFVRLIRPAPALSMRTVRLEKPAMTELARQLRAAAVLSALIARPVRPVTQEFVRPQLLALLPLIAQPERVVSLGSVRPTRLKPVSPIQTVPLGRPAMLELASWLQVAVVQSPLIVLPARPVKPGLAKRPRLIVPSTVTAQPERFAMPELAKPA